MILVCTVAEIVIENNDSYMKPNKNDVVTEQNSNQNTISFSDQFGFNHCLNGGSLYSNWQLN